MHRYITTLWRAGSRTRSARISVPRGGVQGHGFNSSKALKKGVTSKIHCIDIYELHVQLSKQTSIPANQKNS